jgi:Fe-S-cluster containining protein
MIFQCLPNCALCCGLVGFTKDVLEKHSDKYPKDISVYEVKGLYYFEAYWCPFLGEDKKCKIYEDRPQKCREYGSEELPCPYLKPNGKRRGLAKQKQILREQHRKFNKAEELKS